MPTPPQESHRKFDSAIQKTRPPITDPVRFNRLVQKFAEHIGAFMKDLRQHNTPNTEAAERALDVAEQLTVMEPMRAVPWSLKCQALFALGRLPEAIQANQRALEIDPSDSDKWLLHANMLNTSGRTSEAAAALKRAQELN